MGIASVLIAIALSGTQGTAAVLGEIYQPPQPPISKRAGLAPHESSTFDSKLIGVGFAVFLAIVVLILGLMLWKKRNVGKLMNRSPTPIEMREREESQRDLIEKAPKFVEIGVLMPGGKTVKVKRELIL
ncbi:hypothetical protein BGZ60DRAFT_393233 [Tricladium varicosporioides]|nr:hypothetical protein BGZ60DRAFT_393233 [Hymenoscyphus varicosporioides]